MDVNDGDWDDSILNKVFHDSLKKHVTRAHKEKIGNQSKNSILQPQSAASQHQKPTTPGIDAGPEVHSAAPSTMATQHEGPRKKAKAVGFSAALANYLSSVEKKPNSESPSATVPTTSAILQNTAATIDHSIEHNTEPFNNVSPQFGFKPPAVGGVNTALIDEALQTMLMAWYQSGYATGRYQTLCEIAEQQRIADHTPNAHDS